MAAWLVALVVACGGDERPDDVTILGVRRAGSGALLEPQAATSARLRAAYIAAVQSRASDAYWAVDFGDRLWADNPSQRFSTELSRDGVGLSPVDPGSSWTFTFAATRYGCEGDLRPLSQVEPTATENRVTYDRVDATSGEGLIEWYLSGPLGLEQGFTLPKAPPCETAADTLVIALDVGGDLLPIVEGGGDIALRDAEGKAALRFADLHAHDETGRVLASTITVESGRLFLNVEAGGASYPITVDPLIAVEQAKLLASDGAAGDFFGVSVAVWGDTAVVGAYGG